MKNNFLAFDCGASSCRAVIGSLEDGKLALQEIHRFRTPLLRDGGKLYWNVNEILAGFKTAIGKTRGIKIDSIGIDTWGVDFGCIGNDGRLVSQPRSYRDNYTRGVPDKVFEKISRKDLYDITGIQIMDFNTVFQLYAQKQENPQVFDGVSKILFMPDLLGYLLTGQAVCEYTDASTSGFVNQRTREIDSEILSKIDISGDLFPAICQPGTQLGLLSEEIAKECGVERIPVVTVAGHDTASAIIAVPGRDENFAYLSSGTWSLMGIESPKPIINEDSCLANFTNEGGIEGTTRFLKNITGMWILERCRQEWIDDGRNYTYDEMVAMAQRSKYAGLINPDDPAFTNPQSMLDAIDEYLFKTGQILPIDNSDYLRCIYHSLANRYGQVMTTLQDFSPFPIEKLYIIGGGSANNYLNQLTADATMRIVVAGPLEATAIGNLLMQAKAAGLVADRWEMRRIITESFELETFYPQK